MNTVNIQISTLLKRIGLAVVLFGFLHNEYAYSQQDPDQQDMDSVEKELEATHQQKQKRSRSRSSSEVEKDVKTDLDYSELNTLLPFEELSVIQKRFLPKTGRFQLFGGLTTITNDPFFISGGGNFRLGYFFNETWGIEAGGMILTTDSRKITEELRQTQLVSTELLATPTNYFGGSIVWVPIYGKVSWFNEKIIPFDLYFQLGFGSTNLKSGENAPTTQGSAGQIFALSKAWSFRWDFSWNFYNATGIDGSKGSFNNLFLSIGASYFFPEAKYR